LLVVLALGVGAAAGGRASPPGFRGQLADKPMDHATDDGVHHGTADPVLAELESALVAHDTGAALGRLEELAAEDEEVRHRAHHYVHEVGRLSYHHYGSLTEAFRRCADSADSGCYHGVLQAYFAADPSFVAEDVANFCNGGAIPASATWILEFQCLHGLGHGLAVFFDHQVQQPLTYCDRLRTEGERDSCYGGVFMENIVFAEMREGDAAPAAPARAANPQNPCLAVGEQYKRTCYVEQAKAILLDNGHEVVTAFRECEQAPPRYVVPCYQGMGAAISTFTVWDPDRTAELCTLGNDPYRIWCFAGAIKVLFGVHRTADGAIDLCMTVPAEFKTFCFEFLGQLVPSLHTDPAARANECAKAAQPEWVRVCRSSAGLTG
jgi:hypothetical protein